LVEIAAITVLNDAGGARPTSSAPELQSSTSVVPETTAMGAWIPQPGPCCGEGRAPGSPRTASRTISSPPRTSGTLREGGEGAAGACGGALGMRRPRYKEDVWVREILNKYSRNYTGEIGARKKMICKKILHTVAMGLQSFDFPSMETMMGLSKSRRRHRCVTTVTVFRSITSLPLSHPRPGSKKKRSSKGDRTQAGVNT